MSDPREVPCNGRVAPLSWRGRVEAERFVEPERRAVSGASAFLLAGPGGRRERELLHGEGFDVLEARDGHAFGSAARDGYVGWVPEAALGPDPGASHAVAVRRTLLFPAPDLKRPPVAALSFGARLAAEPDGVWMRTRWAGVAAWAPAMHLRAVDAPMSDPAGVAELFLGAPYLWGGNGSDGLDCSGLVQAALLACGIACPGDADQQEAAMGGPLPDAEPLRRGDLVFWAGHVAIALDRDRLLHANAGAMAVSIETLDRAVARIEAQGDGRPTSRRRPRPPALPRRDRPAAGPGFSPPRG